MINKRGASATLGFVLVMIFFLFMVTTFALIEPLKESLNNNRGSSTLNCPGTADFDQAGFDDDTRLEKLTRRPTCFVTGLSMVWFVFAFLTAAVVWVVKNWRRIVK